MDSLAANLQNCDIIITHFINPNQFWYKLETFNINEKQHDLETKLAKYLLHYQSGSCYRNQQYIPEKDEIVAACIENRWIRAIVDEIVNNDKLTLWAIDDGKPVKCSVRCIRHIPEEIANLDIGTVFFGGINNIVPAEKTFDFMTYSSKLIGIKKWSEEAIKLCENIINRTYTCTFYIEKTRQNNNQHFGQLKITTDTNETLNIKDVLIKSNHGIERIEKFDQIIDKYELNKSPRWLQFKGICTLYNRTTIKLKQNIHTLSNNNCNEIVDKYAIDKVMNWQKNNEQSCTTNNINNVSITSNDSIDDDINYRKTISRNLYYKNLDKIPLPRDNDKNIVPGFESVDNQQKISENIIQLDISKNDIIPADFGNITISTNQSIDTEMKKKRLDDLKKRYQPLNSFKFPGGANPNSYELNLKVNK